MSNHVQISVEELEALRKRLAEAEARAEALSRRNLTLKVAKSGAVSLYGLNRFPVTLYKDQWLAVLDASDTIREFIQANDKVLSTKS